MAIQNVYHGAPFDAGATFAAVIQNSPALFDPQPDHFVFRNGNGSIVILGSFQYTAGGVPQSGTATGFIVYNVDLSADPIAPPLLVATGYAIDFLKLNQDLAIYAGGSPAPFLADLNVVTTYNGSHDNDIIIDITTKAAHLNGYEGNDQLFGKTGNDVLSGGPGSDAFVFDTKPNSTANFDRITDFSVPADGLYIENAVFTAVGAAGVLGAAKFFKGAHAHDSNDRIIYNPATGAVLYDSNGSAAGHEVKFAVLAHNLPLTHFDFLVI